MAEENTPEPVPEALPGVPKLKKGRRSPGKAVVRANKPNAWELQERRQRVLRLRLRGLSYANIGKLLNLQIPTVMRDLEAVQKQSVGKVSNFQQHSFVAEALTVHDEIIERAWSEFSAAQEGTQHRLKSLDLIRVTQADKVKVLQDCGVIKKVTEEKTIKHTFELPWDEETKDAVVMTLLQKRLTPQLAEPTSDESHEPGKNDESNEQDE
jgi:DNA-binding CsgD family transcriptional regulator